MLWRNRSVVYDLGRIDVHGDELMKRDYKSMFEEKLRKETGFTDLQIDWDSYHRTAPVYFRSGDPSVCSSFANISCKSKDLRELLLYGSLKNLCNKNVHFAMWIDSITLKVHPNPTTKLNPV